MLRRRRRPFGARTGACKSIFLHAAAALCNPRPPPTRRTAPFNQTITIDYIFVFNNTVMWQYDSTTQPVGSSLYAHGRGQNDEMCTAVRGKERSDEPCTLLASTDGWRRVIFPESKQCCKFCNVSQFCGIVSPAWLQTGATYQGRRELAGMACDGWLKAGSEQNYYFADAATQQPCEYFEGYPTLPASSNYWRFLPALFSRAAIPAAAFAPPAGCDAMCDVTDVPFAQRIRERHAAGVGAIEKRS